MIVTEQHGAVATIEVGFHSHRGGLAADLALFSGHADALEVVEAAMCHASWHIVCELMDQVRE